MKGLILVALFQLCTLALAQQQLVVNGLSVAGLSSSLMPGTSYVAAEPFAEALGASYSSNGEVASFRLGARVVTLMIYPSANQAAPRGQALEINGQPAAGNYGGIHASGTVYVPVSDMARAFGGDVTYLAESNTVMVVLPRATLTEVSRPNTDTPSYERLIFELSALVPYSEHALPAQNTVQLRLNRTDLSRAQRFSGRYFSSATVEPNGGRVDVRLALRPGYDYDLYAAPQGSGNNFALVLDIFPAEAASEREHEPLQRRNIVIDPGHGGLDSGIIFPDMGSESSLTLTFAQRLAQALAAAGYTATLTRRGDVPVSTEARKEAAISASLFISLHAAKLNPGQIKLYYLGEADDQNDLTLALRENAAALAETSSAERTDRLRQRILLEFLPNLDFGEAAARRISSALIQSGPYNPQVSAAPLYVLSGAAGRGLMLELSPTNLASEVLPEVLAQSVASFLQAMGIEP